MVTRIAVPIDLELAARLERVRERLPVKISVAKTASEALERGLTQLEAELAHAPRVAA